MGWKEWFGFSFVKEKEKHYRKIIIEEIQEDVDGKYKIRTIGHLFWLARMVNEGYCNFQNKIVKLEADLDLNGYLWTPIGDNMQTAFSGVFDGGGRKITGLRINSGEPYVGFFGVVRGVNRLITAEIYYLDLFDIHVIGSSLHSYTGGLVGYAQEGVRIDKCSVNGEVESACYAGGIVGCADDCVSVRNSQCSGRVGGNGMAGALVGQLVANSSVINCSNFVNDPYGRSEDRIAGIQDETSIIK